VEEFVFRIEFKDALDQLTHPLFVIVPARKDDNAWVLGVAYGKELGKIKVSGDAVMMMRF
jgi:hypothetical protein